MVAERKPGIEVGSDAEMLAYARATGDTVYHPVGTVWIGSDAAASLDPELRVVDASVMPRLTSGNTNAPTIIIAGKASDMILSDARVMA